jgi:hypothetical protein
LKAKNPNKTTRVFAFGPAQFSSDTNESFTIGMEIMRMEFVPEIISGKLRGLSTAYKVRKWECSICHGDLEECPHEVGKKYGNVKCQMIATDVEPIDISVVYVPKDPRCRITDLLVVNNGKSPEYIWYGFRVNKDSERFQNIQKAHKSGLIPEKAAFFFAEFFSINLEGRAIFS